ncbi:MAG: glycosyltransferase family 4 protein [Candidatus Melainabacteria bacterium]
MNEPLNLCYLADVSNIHVRRWLSFFAQRGHLVTCLSDKPGELDGVTVLNIPNRDTLMARGEKKVSKTRVLKARKAIIRQHIALLKPDVLHGIFLYQRGWSAVAANYAPTVLTLLGSDIYLPRHHYRNGLQLWRDRQLNRLSLRLCDLVTAVSNDLKVRAESMVGNQPPVELLPIGTNPAFFMPDIDTNALRRSLTIPDNAYVIFSPRQITPLYNQDVILKSLPRVLEEIPDAVLILKDAFKEDSDKRRAYVENLKTLAGDLGVAASVRWVDEVPMSELARYYNLADVVVSVPSTDGMPVTLFDAMACRKPVIVGDLSSYDEVIMHGQTGLRVPTHNQQALAQAIIKLRNNPELVQRIVDESQVILQAYGLFDQQMQRMERYYFGLKFGTLGRKAGPARAIDRFCFNALVALT